MNVKNEILEIMREWAPEDTAEEWDNVGLQLDTKRDIQRIALVLEINLDTLSIIKEYPYDFIVSHHPLIFKPLHSLGYDGWFQQTLRALIQDDIGLYVSHTNLDRASEGVTHALLRQLDLSIDKTDTLSDGYGKLVHLVKPIDFSDVDEQLDAVAKIVPDNLNIKTIALMGGSGKSFVKDVIQANADLYITGELGYHDMQFLRQENKAVILLGHYQSEVFILDTIHEKLKHLDIEIDIIK
tara:strand:+ start:674 stop:1393 length:720 start_codon:yes stop_codon:yes gene_type:complete